MASVPRGSNPVSMPVNRSKLCSNCGLCDASGRGQWILDRDSGEFSLLTYDVDPTAGVVRATLRVRDGIAGGPPPFAKSDRSRFLQALDAALVRLKRE